MHVLGDCTPPPTLKINGCWLHQIRVDPGITGSQVQVSVTHGSLVRPLRALVLRRLRIGRSHSGSIEALMAAHRAAGANGQPQGVV